MSLVNKNAETGGSKIHKSIEPRPATRRHVARPVGKANAATKFVPWNSRKTIPGQE